MNDDIYCTNLNFLVPSHELFWKLGGGGEKKKACDQRYLHWSKESWERAYHHLDGQSLDRLGHQLDMRDDSAEIFCWIIPTFKLQ